jgi:hypothetical protein
MVTPKNTQDSRLDPQRANDTEARRAENSRMNDEENSETRFASHNVEEVEEDYDDEELTDADFYVDEEDEDEDL